MMTDGGGPHRTQQPEDGWQDEPQERLGRTIAARLAERLQRFITEVEPGFEPGRRIDVEAIAARFGVSATPVKQALKCLEERGLVEIKPRRGHYVMQLSDLDVREIMTTRGALEQASIRLCTAGIDSSVLDRAAAALERGREAITRGDVESYRAADLEFHRLWIEASANRRLAELYDILLAQAQIVYVYVPQHEDDIAASLSEHDELLRVARTGDLRRFERALAQHWQNSVDRALSRYQSYLERGAQVRGADFRRPRRS